MVDKNKIIINLNKKVDKTNEINYERCIGNECFESKKLMTLSKFVYYTTGGYHAK